jgi:hypothetical protein
LLFGKFEVTGLLLLFFAYLFETDRDDLRVAHFASMEEENHNCRLVVRFIYCSSRIMSAGCLCGALNLVLSYMLVLGC